MLDDQIKLCDLQWEDRVFFYRWIKDEEAIKYSLSLFQQLRTTEAIDDWFRSVLEDKKSINKGIIYRTELIGYAGVASLSQMNKSGEYFIFIGDKKSWGQGIGTYVTKKIADLAFSELNLNRLSLTVSEVNKAALKAYLKAGFVEEGRLRQACFRDGYYHDKVVMSILRSDRTP